MAFKPIKTPDGKIMQCKDGKVRIIWSKGCTHRLNKEFATKQEIIDNEVVRLCGPLVPKRTGALEKSGTLGTVLGSGQVQYIAPYARRQYYSTAQTRDYDPRRGGMWFERMKVSKKDHILRLISKEG